MLRSELVKQLNELPDVPVCVYDEEAGRYREATEVLDCYSRLAGHDLNKMIQHIRLTFELKEKDE